MSTTKSSWDSQGGPSPEMVEDYLTRGLILRRWYMSREAAGDTRGNFPLIAYPDFPATSFGFFSEVPTPAGPLPVVRWCRRVCRHASCPVVPPGRR